LLALPQSDHFPRHRTVVHRHGAQQLRQRALEAIQRVKWTPAWGEQRISNMIASRPDWCISRQRVWGVPIIAFFCEVCNESMTDRRVLDRIVALFREHTADVWYEKVCRRAGGRWREMFEVRGRVVPQGKRHLDVWFDSGSSHLAVLNKENGLPWPSDMYMEGGDQYRGWFHSSLLIGVGLRGDAPYRASATHGWTLDEHGHAMHKSKGNAIEPDEIIKKYGAELLRLWTASVEFTEDVRLSPTILDRLVEAYRKLRNTFRYALGNLHDFDPMTDAVPVEQMLEIDRWILARTEVLVRNCRQWYLELAFHKVYRGVYDFATAELSAVYFDVLKDRLYTAATTSRARRSGQTGAVPDPLCADSFGRAAAGVHRRRSLGLHGETVGRARDGACGAAAGPAELTSGLDAAKLAAWDELMNAREKVLKALEESRQTKFIGTSLEARVRISGGPPVLETYAADLSSLFIVSQVILEAGDGEMKVAVERADGVKCERCWKYSTKVGEDAKYPTVCDTCAAALREMLG
jgi:isoleucyl-tRNA synthetase